MIRRLTLALTSLSVMLAGSLASMVRADEPDPDHPNLPAAKSPDPSILQEVKAPPGFKVTVFAAPPEVRYPTCIAASPTGELFVGIDENGSLDASPKRGRIVRCVDQNGDGMADQFDLFTTLDSPRGLIYDDGTLYVLHPPTLSAYHDDDHDGKADRSEVLVDGIGFDLNFRGADHTTNGIRLGIDGWIYIAVGDYGFIKAVGQDKTELQMHGGGVARVRTDGSGLEIFSRGQRNIYDVSIDPLLNVFTRDNTNDGDGWDVRLSHVIQSGQYGYPSLFTRFTDETLAPLADYGGGSPTGSLFIQEPGLPAEYGNTLLTCEWGRSMVDRHPLEREGAGFKAGKETFLELPRPTDIDVDGQSRLYVASWRAGEYRYGKPDVGYVVRVTYPEAKVDTFPNLKASGTPELLGYLSASSATLRLAAQRALLKRGDRSVASQLETLAKNDGPLAARVAALCTLDQLLGLEARDALARLASVEAIREFALMTLAGRTTDAAKVPTAPFLSGLADPNPRIRLQAVIGLARLGRKDAAPAILARTADADPRVAHVAINALVSLDAVEACLNGISAQTPEVIPGAVRALQGLHEKPVVDGLIAKLDRDKEESVQRACLKALCRLYFREADWDGKWWGTRPDTSGPYFTPVTWSESERIGKALSAGLKKADTGLARWLLIELLKNKVDLEGSNALALDLARQDPMLREAILASLSGRKQLDDGLIRFLRDVSTSEHEETGLKVKALRTLSRGLDQPQVREAALAGFALALARKQPDPALASALQDFIRDNRLGRDLGAIVALADRGNSAQRELAFSILLQAGQNGRAGGRGREAAQEALKRAWTTPEGSTLLLAAVGRTRARQFSGEVRSRLNDKDQAVRLAAQNAARLLNLDAKGEGKGNAPASPMLKTLEYDRIVEAVTREKGNPELGAELFQRQNCTNCHTSTPDQPPKGPFLGGIATRYSRAELIESILKPSAKLAQGFETQKFATADGRLHEGFVTRESGDEVEIRNAAGEATVLPKDQIEERNKSDVSVMPVGLGDSLSAHDLASILAYFESLKGK